MLTKTPDVERLARELGVQPPPLPLSDKGQKIAAALLGEPPEEDEEEPSPLVLTDTREKLLALLLWSQGYAWPERTGPTDKLTYEAVIKTAIAANALTVEVSRYTLAELTGISPSTARLSLKRHVARGRLMAFPRKDEARATPYRVDLDVLQSHTKPRDHSSLLALFRLNLQQPPPDLFCGKQGLSKAALRVYEKLDPKQAQTSAELGRKLDRNRSSVGRLLKQLANFDLAVKVDDGWLKLDADLEKLAEEQGTAGTTERKRAYHESLRSGLRAYLEHKRGNSNGEGSRSEGVRPAKGAMVSEARAARRTDRGTALPRRSAEPVSGDHGRGIPVEPMEKLGPHTADLLADDRPRLSVGGNEMGNGTEGREAACLGCGQVQTFTAPDLRPYSCAYCKGRFEFVDEPAMAVA